MPHVMLAVKAIIDEPVLMDPNSAIDAGHQIAMGVLAESFVEGRRQPDLLLHSNSSCNLDVFVSQFAVFLENFLGQLEHQLYSCLSNFLLALRFFMIFLRHLKSIS